ncbi:hypothetical protein M0804_011080 [Polistes exclamans]|nr:hypothetical protein M0804_011080 [Polistes exclamans]
MVVDTVINSIERKLIAMEAILHRDQRTTSHRVVLNKQHFHFVSTINTETMLRSVTKDEKKIIEDGNLTTHHSKDNLVSLKNDHRRTDYYDITTCQRFCSHSCSSTRGNSDKVSVQRHLRRDLCQKCINTSSSSSSSSSCSSLDNKVRRDRHRRFSIINIFNIWISLIVIQVIMTSANGAPLKSKRQDPPMWVNPCGLAAEDFNSDPEIEQLKDFDLISQIIVQLQTALSHTSLFREDFELLKWLKNKKKNVVDYYRGIPRKSDDLKMIRCMKRTKKKKNKNRVGRGMRKKVSAFHARPQRALTRRPWFRLCDYGMEKGSKVPAVAVAVAVAAAAFLAYRLVVVVIVVV